MVKWCRKSPGRHTRFRRPKVYNDTSVFGLPNVWFVMVVVVAVVVLLFYYSSLTVEGV